jgi:hypothetical protein
MTSLPPATELAQLPAFLDDPPWWTAFWDKKYQLWRVTEDDADSDLYAESPDTAAILSYMTAHS